MVPGVYWGGVCRGPFAFSTHNFVQTISQRGNNTVLRLATNGAGTLTVVPWIGSAGQAHLIMDVDGSFSEDATPAAGARGPFGYQTLTPCRVADTRNTGSPITGNTTRNFKVQGNCGVPVGAKAAVLNVTVLGMGSGWLTVSASGSPVPFISSINFSTAQGWLGNGVIAPLSTSANDLSIRAAGAVAQVLVDFYGYFQ